MIRTVGRSGGQEWSRAFSLVEVVIALGVVSVSVFAILGLLPVGYKDASDSRRETCAAFIAQQIAGDLRSSPFNAATILCRGTDGKLAALQTTYDLTQSGTYVLACDAQDNILRQLGSGTYDSPYTVADTAFLARVTVTPAAVGNSAQVQVEVSAPPAAASAQRSRFGFVTTVEGGS